LKEHTPKAPRYENWRHGIYTVSPQTSVYADDCGWMPKGTLLQLIGSSRLALRILGFSSVGVGDFSVICWAVWGAAHNCAAATLTIIATSLLLQHIPPGNQKPPGIAGAPRLLPPHRRRGQASLRRTRNHHGTQELPRTAHRGRPPASRPDCRRRFSMPAVAAAARLSPCCRCSGAGRITWGGRAHHQAAAAAGSHPPPPPPPLTP